MARLGEACYSAVTRVLSCNKALPRNSESATVFGDFDGFGDLGSSGGTSGPDDPAGCVWHIIFICFATMLVIGFLKWMS